MAALVLTDAFVEINAIDHSDHVRQVSVDANADAPESTAMSAAGWRAFLAGGLKGASLTVEFNQDYVAANVDEKMFALLGVSTAIKVRPVKSAAISTNNPELQFNGILTSFPPVSGAVGERAAAAVNFIVTGALVRDVTP